MTSILNISCADMVIIHGHTDPKIIPTQLLSLRGIPMILHITLKKDGTISVHKAVQTIGIAKTSTTLEIDAPTTKMTITKSKRQVQHPKGITRQFSAPRTPQQNGVAERRNRTLIEAARTMLSDAKLPITFWAEAVNTACYVQNRILVVKSHGMTPYEIWHKRKPFIGFLKPFGCQCTILNTKDYLAKFAEKSAEGYFVGYSSNAKAYRVYIKAPRVIEESTNVQFNEHTLNKPGTGPDWLFDLNSFTSAFNLVKEYVPVSQSATTDTSKGSREDDFRVELGVFIGSVNGLFGLFGSVCSVFKNFSF
ncbi:hypothetical protein E3N88_05879 [Mikania micrantha]|uniref:Integrase catalytic domain-containing protein n=1 Tax=Mikania micrantha TaxID=192012 RepID=A0A5N6PM70_9ASTR|nr:hypothetical protein E3N88_05879 [Mikania micrantha]